MKKLAIVAILVVLGGCQSIESVPLVYVSSNKVGVDVSVGTADSPGANLTIGANTTDAAYVPVAVARNCNSVNGTTNSGCESFGSDIMRLYGGSSPVTRLEDSLAQIAGDNGQISGIPVEKLLAGFSDTDSDRSDALSVFGSFEARVGGNAGAQNSAGASLGFGKLFATGVAAQNLSVGVDDVAVARAGANCLVSMNSILSGLPEAERTAGVVSALAQVCGLGDMEQTAGYGGETPPGTEAQPPEGETEQQPEGDAGEEIVPDPEEPNTQV